MLPWYKGTPNLEEAQIGMVKLVAIAFFTFAALTVEIRGEYFYVAQSTTE